MRSETSSNQSARVRVRLIRKIAEHVDGVDVTGHAVGETFELTSAEAALLVAEGWAVLASEDGAGRHGVGDGKATTDGGDGKSPGFFGTADREGHELTLAQTLQRLGELRAEIEQRRRTTEYDRRRAEDVIREELRDSRAKTIRAADRR